MNTVTLSLEDYNRLKDKEKAFEQLKKESYSILVLHAYYSDFNQYFVLNKDETVKHFEEDIIKLKEVIRKLTEPKSLWQRLFK